MVASQNPAGETPQSADTTTRLNPEKFMQQDISSRRRTSRNGLPQIVRSSTLGTNLAADSETEGTLAKGKNDVVTPERARAATRQQTGNRKVHEQLASEFPLEIQIASHLRDIRVQSVDSISASLERIKSQHADVSIRNDNSSDVIKEIPRISSSILASLNDLAAASTRLHSLFLRESATLSKDGQRHLQSCIIDLKSKQKRLELIGSWMEGATSNAFALNRRLDASKRIIEAWGEHDSRKVRYKWSWVKTAAVAIILSIALISYLIFMRKFQATDRVSP